MKLSFVTVTNGAKARELDLHLKSILTQQIPNFEIIIVGDIPAQLPDHPSIVTISAKNLTDKKLLGALRNIGCSKATYENFIISDDDMVLSPNWYETLIKTPDFQILTSRVNLPDGGRYWDHTCYQSPTKGHLILEEHETDSHLYMSGGQSWIMKKAVFEKVKWGEEFNMAGGSHSMSNLKDYIEGKHNEDTDFAEKCRKESFSINHNHNLIAWHNDDSYTTVGKICRRRQNNRQSDWVNSLDINFPPPILAQMGTVLFNSGFEAEGFDLVRYGLSANFQNPELKTWIEQAETLNAGKLSDTDYHPGGSPNYHKLIQDLNK